MRISIKFIRTLLGTTLVLALAATIILPTFFQIVSADTATYTPNQVLAGSFSNVTTTGSASGSHSADWSTDGNTLTAVLSNTAYISGINGSTGATTGTLDITGSPSLGDVTGTLRFTFSVTAKASQGSTTKGQAGADSGTSSLNFTLATFEGNTRSDKEQSIAATTCTITNWNASSSLAATMTAMGGYTKGYGGLNLWGSIVGAYDATAYTSSVTITISNITFQPDTTINLTLKDTDVDYTADYTKGDKTAGATVVNDDADHDIAIIEGNGITITGETGYHCVRLVCSVIATDGSGNTTVTEVESLTPDGSGLFYPKDGYILTPVFVYNPSTTAPFKVDDASFWTWESAFVAVAKSTSKTVVLCADYTLPNDKVGNGLEKDGNYVTFSTASDGSTAVTYLIPDDTKFLVPYSSTDTGTFSALTSSQGSTATPSTYVTLTVPSNVTITCSGAINVNGQRHENVSGITGTGGPGRPMGQHGLIELRDGALLELKGTAELYCYGFIAGDGKVDVASGGKVWELFQLYDWCGGTNLLGSLTDLLAGVFGSEAGGWYGKADENTLFLLSQYYLQNVEAEIVFHSGAAGYGEAYIAAGDTEQRETIPCIGGDKATALFKIGSGAVVSRRYDKDTDRVYYKMFCEEGEDSGEVSIGAIQLTVSISVVTKTVSSDAYTFPLNNAMTIQVGDGIEFNLGVRAALMPGSEIIVDEGGVLNIKQAVSIFDVTGWNNELSFNGTIACAPTYTAGRGTSQKLDTKVSAKLEVNGTLNVSAEGGIFATSGYTLSDGSSTSASDPGKVVTGTGTIVNNSTLELKPLKAGYNETLHEVHLTPAVGKLAGLTDANDANDYDTFSTGTYYGDKGDFWYQHTVKVNNPAYAPYVTLANGYTGADSKPDDGIIAYICSGGSMEFTAGDFKVAASGATLAEAYSISNPTGNVTLTLSVPFKVQMVLGSSLDMRFAIPASLFGNDTFTVRVTKGDTTKTFAGRWTETPIGDVNYKFFTVQGMSATEMTVQLTVCVLKNGAEFAVYTESIQSYAMRMLNDGKYASAAEGSTDALARTMLVDMLNYGAAAQTYFATKNGTEVGTLPTSELGGLTGTTADPFTDTAGIDGVGSSNTTAALQLGGNIDLLIKFSNYDGAAYAKVDFDSHWDEVTEKLSGQIYRTDISSDGVVTVDRLLIADARQIVTVSLYNESGEKIAEISDSIAAYLKRMYDTSEMQDLCLAALRFSDSAKAFLHARWTSGPQVGKTELYNTDS